jgi:hypothetical protein
MRSRGDARNARALTQALCRDKRRNAIRCRVGQDLGIVPTMKTIGMSPSIIEQQGSAATSEAQHFRIAAILQAHDVGAIRSAQRQASAIAVPSCISSPTHRIRGAFGVCSTHKPTSPHNKPLVPTRKSEALLLAAQRRR